MAVDSSTLHGDHQALFAALPADGTTMSNPTLRRRLGWASERYFRSCDTLVDMGLVVHGQGHGGVGCQRHQRTKPWPAAGWAPLVKPA
jgi:hypothetical protein